MSALSERRLGRVVVSRETIQDDLYPYIHREFEIILETKRDYITDNLYILAASAKFDVVKSGDSAPFYDYKWISEEETKRDITGAIIGSCCKITGIEWSKKAACGECGAQYPLAWSAL